MEIFRKKARGLVGLEIEAGSIAATEVQVNGSPRVVGTAIEPLPPNAFHEGEVADAEALTEALRALYSKQKLSKRVRLGIANQRVVVRTLRLPALDDPKELAAAVRFQAQEQILMPIDQAVLDHRVVGGVAAEGEDTAKVDVVVVAARRDMIESSLAPLRKAGLQPVGIDLSAFGLIRALADAVPPPQEGSPEGGPPATLFCNVGDATNLAIAKGRACLFTRVAPVGFESIVSGLVATAGLTPEHAAMWLDHVGLDRPLEEVAGDPGTVAAVRGALETGASALQDELRLSLDFYSAQEGSAPIGNVVLGGPGSAIAGLPERVESFLGLPLQVGRPAALAGLDASSAARLTLSYGLALDA
ncbi:MAG TPA: type IV pilus assembly protein PilM [Solirubrobacterales bacterium]|nr:type IV pilus assembly protein PilM [Solirubrobacterales bacterium]